jgi:hypothetical protein
MKEQKLYKITLYGKKLNGKLGCTGELNGLTWEKVEVFKRNMEKQRDDCLSIDVELDKPTEIEKLTKGFI